MSSEEDVTTLLQRWSDGDGGALLHLIPLVYDDLRRMARRRVSGEPSEETLQPTALVHEVYLRLQGESGAGWQNRQQFFAVASMLMRRILIDYARSVRSAKRGGGNIKLSLDESVVLAPERAAELVALDEALTRLAEHDPRKARVVEMRFFGGLTIGETAEALDVGSATVVREWRLAKAWLYREVSRSESNGP